MQKNKVLLITFLFSVILGGSYFYFLGDNNLRKVSSLEFDQIKYGEYLAKNSGCVSCHTSDISQPLGGGYQIDSPVGLFVTPNISSSRDYGIGEWSDSDFLKAVKKGLSPEGENYYPAFPYTNFSKLSDYDVLSIKRYIETLPAIDKPSLKHRFDNAMFDNRFMVGGWKKVYFSGGFKNPIKDFYLGDTDFEISSDRFIQKSSKLKSLSEENLLKWKRGAYLVEAVFHCTQCHSPRGEFPILNNVVGAPKVDYWMGGSDGIPNITPSKKYGIGVWSTEDYLNYFKTGANPQGRFSTSSGMDKVIKRTKVLTEDDLSSLVYYLRSLPPVDSLNMVEF